MFVPGPGDAGPVHVLPRPPLAPWLTADLREALRYGTQQMVLFRDDLEHRMRRQVLMPPPGISSLLPGDAELLIEHLAKELMHSCTACCLRTRRARLAQRQSANSFQHALGQKQSACSSKPSPEPTAFQNPETDGRTERLRAMAVRDEPLIGSSAREFLRTLVSERQL